jgi:transcriptional regulator with XRE-family HTH domain
MHRIPEKIISKDCKNSRVDSSDDFLEYSKEYTSFLNRVLSIQERLFTLNSLFIIGKNVMPEALITPNVLKWARKRARFTLDRAAQKVQVRPERFIAWEEGNIYPTFRQAKKLAKAFRVPFGYFFLPAPPKEKIDIPDLRTVGGQVSPDFNLEFFDLYHDILRKQDWFREYRLQEGKRSVEQK